MAYCFARFVSWLCCLLPGCFCERLGIFLSALTWYLVPSRRREMAVNNARVCLGVDERRARQIVRDSWIRFGPMLFEVMRFPVLKARFLDLVEIEGGKYLREGLALGRGAVIATAHSGNWELMMDQDVGRREGIVVEWFGRPTNFVQGPAVLARYKNAPLLPGYIHRLPDGRHRIILHPPIFVARTKDKAADILKAMEEVGRVLEHHIRQYPEEWFWLHDRWKSLREEG